jgi:hypothetical protein
MIRPGVYPQPSATFSKLPGFDALKGKGNRVTDNDEFIGKIRLGNAVEWFSNPTKIFRPLLFEGQLGVDSRMN